MSPRRQSLKGSRGATMTCRMRNLENRIGEFFERWHIQPMIAGATIVIGGLSLTLLAAGLVGLDVREVYGFIDRAVHYCLGDLIFWTVIGLLASGVSARSNQRPNKASAPSENDPGRFGAE